MRTIIDILVYQES